jgi:signal transduction histidine kinase
VSKKVNLWQLSALLLRASQTRVDAAICDDLTSQLNDLLQCSDASQWAAAARDICDQQQSQSTAADVEVSSLDHSIEQWTRRLRQELRFREAVERRVAQTMYNFCYGLTHEINNPLANISARAQGLRAKATDPAAAASLDNIVRQTHRAHEMLAEMMLAVRPPAMPLEALELNPWIERLANDLGQQARQAQLQFTSHIDVRRLPVRANAVALGEMLLAVFQNSVDACEVGGQIELRCERVETNSAEHPWNDSMPQIRIAICDNGAGMSPDKIAQAFDLYYCGREAGRSLGIGLAKSRRIVEAHSGQIWLESHDGIGTATEIRLPWAVI